MNVNDRRVRNVDNIRAWSKVPASDLEAFGDSGDFARQHLLTPALLNLLGDVSGKQILDAGAGNGYLSRMLAQMDATVTAVEPADGPFHYMQQREADEPIGLRLLQQDLSTMDQFEDEFDAVIANMVLLDIADFRPAIANCLRATKPGGAFIFSLEHPFTDVADRAEGPFKVTDYFTERAFSRAIGHNFHRTLETYIDALADNGAVVERIKEPRLPADVAARHPDHAWGRDLPAFIVIMARRSSSSSPG